jgi:CubicO group peptidase (beta-lactamase class C family)
MSTFSPERLARIAPLLEDRVAAGLPGVVALVARGQEAHVATAGVQDLASHAPMRRDTIFRIASMTKPLVASIALTLIEEGYLALDDPVDRWLPELANRRVLRRLESELDDTTPAVRPITVRDVMTFRLGLGVIMAPPDSYPIQRAMSALGVTPGPRPLAASPDEFIRRLGSLPLVHQPGERWLYHTGIDVLVVLIERVARRPFAGLLAERLTGPLGMADTAFQVPERTRARIATAYAWQANDGGIEIWDRAEGAWSVPPAFPGSLVSTADDYLAFCRMLLAGGLGPKGRILSRAAVALMTCDQLTGEQKASSPFTAGFWERTGWGMGGVAITNRRDDICANPGAFGWSGGIGTHFVADPTEGLVAIALTQRLMRSPDDGAIGRDVFTLAYAALSD